MVAAVILPGSPGGWPACARLPRPRAVRISVRMTNRLPSLRGIGEDMTVSNRLRLEAEALNAPAVRQPSRRAGSIRRTSSLQTLWKPDDDRSYAVVGRARDLATSATCDAIVVGEDAISATVSAEGRLASLTGNRLKDRLERFAGLRPGGELRKAMARDMAEECRAETRLHRLLDDLPGAAFLSVAAWYAWEGGVEGHAARTMSMSRLSRPVEGVCLSYVRGSSSMTEDGRGIDKNADHPVGPLPLATDDPLGFHSLVETDDPNQWRLRRTDLWCEDGNLVVDAWFQDSSGIEHDPVRRVIFHEYGLVAHIDAGSLDITAISVTPHVLPYVTCHAAPATAELLIGRNVRELRGLVPVLLKGSAGCTHLNDMLRALQNVAGLADLLQLQQ